MAKTTASATSEITRLPSKLSARRAGLKYTRDRSPGLRRVAHRSGFRYVDAQGSPVRDRETLDRIKALAIPPAWTDVWICPDPTGHLQATGRDDRGRKQYRYHSSWHQVRGAHKYDRLTTLARALPRVRRRLDADLKKPGMPREKVLAAVVRLLERTHIRVGNTEYARTNRSYGLTTILGRHVQVSGSRVTMAFRGKSGVDHQVELTDRRLSKIIRRCQDLPGQELFTYLDDDDTPRDVASEHVNDYLREISGIDITAKDFRTWAGTVCAYEFLSDRPIPSRKKDLKRALVEAVSHVSSRLGNTPAVCRKCYIHPAVLQAFESRSGFGPSSSARRRGLSTSESALLRFLEAAEGGTGKTKSQPTRKKRPLAASAPAS